MYLMERILCKIQFAGKSETPFNLRLNNHRKDVNNLTAIPACNHFKIDGHNFIKHTKFTLIEQLTEISNVSKDTLRLRLKRQEDFWIIKLEGCVAWWLATCTRKPKVLGSSPAASYVQK